MNSVRLASLLALSVVCIAAMSGCGQTGPLYLPGHNPNPPQPMLSQPDRAPSSDTSDASDNSSSDVHADNEMSTPDNVQ